MAQTPSLSLRFYFLLVAFFNLFLAKIGKTDVMCCFLKPMFHSDNGKRFLKTHKRKGGVNNED